MREVRWCLQSLWLALLVVLLVVGCAAPPAPPASRATSASATTQARAKRILRIRVNSDLAKADPAFQATSMDSVTILNVGEGLFTFKPGTWDLQPVLVESYQVSGDGLRIDFKLREGVQFHKGQGELTAEDVKFSYERFLDPKLDAPYKGDWEALDRVEVTGKHSGTIVLKRPFAPLWSSTLPVLAGVVLSKNYVATLGHESYGTSPLGTGPYEFIEWKPNERVTLKRNERYWGERPYWDEIHVVPITDDAAAGVALEAGEVDFTAVTQADRARLAGSAAVRTQSFPTMSYGGVFINVQHPKLSDINVRLALRYAIDADAINQAVHEGAFKRLCAIIAPSQIGYWADAPCYARDVDKAKAFMKKAGLDSLDLTLVIRSNDTTKAKAEIIQANLKDVGINLTIKPEETGAYWEGGFGEKAVRERELALFDWNTASPDPHWQMVWFSCEQVGQYNWMYWCDKDFDQANFEAATTLDPARRSAAYIRAQKLWDADANVVWLLRPIASYAWRADLKPLQRPDGVPMLAEFRLQ